MLREFEEELVWAHYGVKVKNIEHLRLGFYTGEIFTPQPQGKRDVDTDPENAETLTTNCNQSCI